ncbi:DNA-directed RNA polymerase III subunit RPC5-like [Papaver somniferum]|uniref:DNA-directed RNA polymerase III subunit RPC5-like n=1 Tax=Papaver somniferum TaxID=3469 RepID=UPI000E6F6E89|nr:DNA-directed RNA polymerase III subunit RPC5-like [Papaver somniferum]
MDMDLDDLELTDQPNRVATSSRPTRFAPKSAKLKPIPKSEPVILPEPEKTLILPKKQEDIISIPHKNELEGVKQDEESKEEVESKELVESMEVDNDEDDEVVREIDVFFKPSPIDVDTQLYVLQYPLRPSWRPYDMEKCQEVRVKPKKVQVEIDLSLDMDENYDVGVDEHLRITKQTLLSQKVPLTRGCAVGVLVGNKLHLNPVNAVVQLRPSMEHVIPDNLKKKKNIVEATVKSEKTNGGPGPSRTKGNLVRPLNGPDIEVDEPWVSLEYHGVDSIFSSRFRQKMTSEESTPIQFSMNPYDYVNSLCPPTPTEDNRSKSSLRRLCMSLPLEEKFKKWFSEGDQVNRFASIKYLAPYDPEEIVLQEIQKHANLVQGLWVCRTNLLPLKGAEAASRDYILCLFRKSDLIPAKILSEYRKETVKEIMTSLAVYRDTCRDWKFKVPTDVQFIKDHPEIVKEQESLWVIREKKMIEMLNERSMRMKLKPSMATKLAASGNTNSGVKKSVNETSSTASMSDETREALPKVLEDIFRQDKICSLQLIRHRLREQAVEKSARPKPQSRAFRAAALGADIPPSELEPLISQVATNIHGVYVAKSSENTTPNPLRDIVIQLFSAKEPHAKLRKADVAEAAKYVLKREMTNAEYSQVTSELCVSVKGNAWVLKSGDEGAK